MVLTDMSSVAIQTENLSISFNGMQIVKDLSVSFPKNKLSVLIGRSGSGKTTLLRSFNRLNECLDGSTTTGKVIVTLGGTPHDIYSGVIPCEELRRRVGMVFQTPNVLPNSIQNNLLIPLKLALRIQGSEAESRMEHALKQAGLWSEVCDRLKSPATNLSGGQQQRLCIARAMVLQPEILLLDEPSASLDFYATRTIEDLLESLSTEYTTIVVSHSLAQAQRLADRLYVFSSGELVQTLSKEEVQDNAVMQKTVESLF
ncbi:phosphate ABC transporter ATP-binding protein [Halodesulfovibrio marinisediminis]|uniref:Phosphate transport system ATP-binding protein n=1 Tax=Halodesulfovibrio marinisediminis DSM 17456 TaxID=1121457 RepID=A0A1N6E7T9_9BACT|nr:phosphate ABC transporter ATP-binding protein [Halodesulfovibrio marinisediminis]SIN79115.1 phosphate transport system ATP-binding protein [Halodesulfovibrio marinisediminis DSM 17456]